MSYALTRPDGSNPAAFALAVAGAYREAVAEDRDRPAKLIAEASGVPVTTVHRWIREARRVGALEPAKCLACGQYVYPKVRRARANRS